MNERKNLLIHLGEALECYRTERSESARPGEAPPPSPAFLVFPISGDSTRTVRAHGQGGK